MNLLTDGLIIFDCNADSVRIASPAFAEAVDRLVTRLNLSGSGATALAVGDSMPSFMLADDQGHLVSFGNPARQPWQSPSGTGPMVLAQAQCDVEPIGGQIVAITPHLQRFTTTLKADAAAKPFPILTDIDNGYALSLNLVIFVGQEMQKFMKGAGWDIAPYQGNDAWILPIPATFVVGRDSIIRARFVDPDYRKRTATDVVVDALRAC